jgi:hypothetical protein
MARCLLARGSRAILIAAAVRSLERGSAVIVTIVVTRPYPHQGTGDSRKIVFVATTHGDDGDYADEGAVQREKAQRIERNLHAANVTGPLITA